MNTRKNKHPAGLPYLFFSEMCERFGYYLILGIFFLYLTDGTKGGMGLDKASASDLFGTYIAMVFVTPFIGGILADRILGYRLAISIGGILMGIGYFCLAIPGQTAFYSSLCLLILGNGLLKPNIATFLGLLYHHPDYKNNRDSGYNLFYMASNIGALICNFIAAYLRNSYGWGYAFAAAGVAMFIGLIIFWTGNKHYRNSDIIKQPKPEDFPIKYIFYYILLPAIAGGISGWMIPGTITGSNSTDAFLFGSIPIVVFYLMVYKRSKGKEKQSIGGLLAIMAVVSIFWAVFKQNGTALTTWAESYTDRSVPQRAMTLSQSLGTVQYEHYALDTITLTDSQFRVLKGQDGNPIRKIGYPTYFKNESIGKVQPGSTENLYSTELFLSFNPFFVILLTPFILGLFRWLRKLEKEPSTPGKILLGLLITAASSLVMIGAVLAGNNGMEKVSPLWLIGTYAVITTGELCLSPMGLSLVSRLAPPRYAALMMGGWMLSTSIGNKLSGVLAGLWDSYDQKAYFFIVNFVLLLAAAFCLFLMIGWLRRIIESHED
jgi:POT family proton-dependent oligopeptide transporter